MCTHGGVTLTDRNHRQLTRGGPALLRIRGASHIHSSPSICDQNYAGQIYKRLLDAGTVPECAEVNQVLVQPLGSCKCMNQECGQWGGNRKRVRVASARENVCLCMCYRGIPARLRIFTQLHLLKPWPSTSFLRAGHGEPASTGQNRPPNSSQANAGAG